MPIKKAEMMHPARRNRSRMGSVAAWYDSFVKSYVQGAP